MPAHKRTVPLGAADVAHDHAPLETRDVLAALPDPHVSVDRQGLILYANPAAESLLGWPLGGLAGQHITAALPEHLRDAFSPTGTHTPAEMTQRLLGRTTRIAALRRDGQELDLEISVRPLPPAGGTEEFVIALRAVPERIELERQLLLAHYLRAATRAAAALTERLDLSHVLDTLVQTLVREFDAVLARVWLYDATDGGLTLRASAGHAAAPSAPARITLQDSCPLSEVARTRWARVSRELTVSDPCSACLQPLACAAPLASAALLRLLSGGELRGVLAVFFGHPLDDDTLEVLTTLSAVGASAINDATLLELEQRTRAEAESAQQRLGVEREAAESRAWELALANDTLQRQRDELELARSRLAAQYAVLKVLATASSLEEAGPRILEAIGSSMSWDVGALWIADARGGVLRARDVWSSASLQAPDFVERTRRMTYALGEGLVGRVWQTGEPAWVESTHAASFRRAELAAVAGLHGALFFPVRHGAQVYGVVEFFRRDKSPPDEETLHAIGALGNQVGQFIERLQARRSVAEGEERLETTLRSLGEAVITADTLGRVDFMNPVAEALTGWSMGEARGRPLDEVFCVIDEQTRQSIESPLARVMRHEAPVSLANHSLLMSRQGQEAMIDDSAAPIRNERGELLGVVLVFRNVTEKKRAERRRRFIAEASAQLATSLDYEVTLRGVAELSLEGLADWSAVELLEPDGSLRSLANTHRDAALGELAREIRRRWPPDARAAQGIGRVLYSGEPLLIPEVSGGVLASEAKDPEHFRMLQELGVSSQMIVPLCARGRTFGALCFAASRGGRRYNAEDLAVAEELARRAGLAVDNARLYEEAQEAIRARDEFLSIASHELKTPLTSLSLHVQSLLRAARTGEALTHGRELSKLESAEAQARRLAKLINDLLDVSGITNGHLQLELEQVDLGQSAQEVAERFADRAERAGCTIEVQAQPGISGNWDRLRIDQILTNLVSNAVKYGSGKLVRVSVTADQALATLVVEDHGIGIAPEDVERIFNRFERAVSSRHYGGLGVGLYIVRRVLDALGGTIEVRSQPGEGSTFRVLLPRSGPPSPGLSSP